MFAKLFASQVLRLVTRGRVKKPNKAQALSRLPTLLRLTYALIRDGRVPVWQRGAVLGAVALILSPIDAIGNIPVVGQFWDATLAVVVMDVFIQIAPRDVVDEHIARLGLQGKFHGR